MRCLTPRVRGLGTLTNTLSAENSCPQEHGHAHESRFTLRARLCVRDLAVCPSGASLCQEVRPGSL